MNAMNEELDAQAVEAVRQGEPDRYRELIERYERRVYAVAWSRLGDAHLAEEATQEAFIRGYRGLALLRHGGKFAAWITAIARHAAINLGLRHRGELKKRERWALERDAPPERPAPIEDEMPLQNLRQTLAELPPRHRECLALFYLEGKNVAESAAALGIAENAFKTRLHRARTVLRERLEAGLEKSLAELKPKRALAPVIMGIVLAQRGESVAAIGGGGFLAKVAAVAAKLLPAQFILNALALIGLLPGVAFAYWVGRIEQRNYRDADGFRRRNHQRALQRALALTLGSGVVIILLAQGAIARWGMPQYCRLAGLLFLAWLGLLLPLSLRLRSRFAAYQHAGTAALVGAFLGIGFFGWPFWTLFVGQGLFFLLCALALRHQPLRMDYNLFLRASQELMPACPAPPPESSFSRTQLLAFAHFLAARGLLADYRENGDGFEFRLAPVKGRIRDCYFPFFWKDCSLLTVGFLGGARAVLGHADELNLRGVGTLPAPPRDVLEARVSGAVRQAIAAFVKGDGPDAERWLGQQAEQAIFFRAPARSAGVRLRVGVLIAAGVLLPILNTFPMWMGKLPYFRGLGRLAPVTVSEAAVRATLAQGGQTLSDAYHERKVDYGFMTALTFPPRQLFATPDWRTLTGFLWELAGIPRDRTNDPDLVLNALLWNERIQRAVVSGLITPADLAVAGFTRERLRRYLTDAGPRVMPLLFPFAPARAGSGEEAVWSPDWLAVRVQLFEQFKCLDLVDAQAIIERVREYQVRKASATGQVSSPDPGASVGLFKILGNQPLHDTYHALVILSALGGLDRIDQPACARGILRFHRGEGWFAADITATGVYMIGDARDTFFAFESLRMLNALDRVQDLDRWKFRPQRVSGPSVTGATGASWLEIEAWLYQERLNQFLAARRRDSRAVAPSLQSPPELEARP